MKLVWMSVVATALSAFLAGGAQAAPVGDIGGVQRAATEGALLGLAHGGHRSCEWGPVLGWHRHVGIAAQPVPCKPLSPQPFRCWVDYWGVKHCRW